MDFRVSKNHGTRDEAQWKNHGYIEINKWDKPTLKMIPSKELISLLTEALAEDKKVYLNLFENKQDFTSSPANTPNAKAALDDEIPF